jgi:hypothetical protein
MNAMLTPLPTEKEQVPEDCVKWFIGYMPVSTESFRADPDVCRLPPLPDFSEFPSWAAVTDLGSTTHAFSGGFREVDMESWSVRMTMPQPEVEENAVYTDEDLHDALANLMVADEDSRGDDSLVPSEIAPMVRSAARRAVAEMVDPRMRCDAPMSLGCVCGGIKAMVGRWISHRSGSGADDVRQVIGLQLFRKNPAELLVSCGVIPMVAEDEIRKVLEDASGSTGESVHVNASTRLYFMHSDARVLAAIVRGEPDDTMIEDLAYLLQRIDMRIATPQVSGVAWDASIRALLQEGLLIRAPMGTGQVEHANSA